MGRQLGGWIHSRRPARRYPQAGPGGTQPNGRSGATVALVVQKYGGSSVADADGIKRVAQRIVATRKSGASVAVAVPAMGDTPPELSALPPPLPPLPPPRAPATP